MMTISDTREIPQSFKVANKQCKTQVYGSPPVLSEKHEDVYDTLPCTVLIHHMILFTSFLGKRNFYSSLRSLFEKRQ